jgi:galactokinase
MNLNPKDKVLRIFKKRFDTNPVSIGWAPGRVNLMGEHVDYNDGFVLPAAIDRMTFIAFSPSGTDESTILAADYKREVHLMPRNLEGKFDSQHRRLPGWALFPAGVMWAANLEHLPVPGMNAVFASDVPRGAGLSSSASVETAFCKAWQAEGEWSISNEGLARLAQRAESQYVGVRCGIMDQYASLCGRRGYAIYLDCRTLNSCYVALPPGASIIVADSGIRHHLSAGVYNERRSACDEAVRQLRTWIPGIQTLRDVTPDQFNNYEQRLTENIRSIARHVIEEIERTTRSVDMLESGNLAGFGTLMVESHASLRDLYQVSCPELDSMVRIAIETPGCYGARLTGAGFGGCTVNLVDNRDVDKFICRLTALYLQDTGIKAKIYVCQASDGAGVRSLFIQ